MVRSFALLTYLLRSITQECIPGYLFGSLARKMGGGFAKPPPR